MPMNFDTVLSPELAVQTDPEESTATPAGVLLATQKFRKSDAIPAGVVRPEVIGLAVLTVPSVRNSLTAPATEAPVVKPVAATWLLLPTATATGPCNA